GDSRYRDRRTAARGEDGGRGATQAGADQRVERDRARRLRPAAAAAGRPPPSEAALRDAGADGAADLRHVRERRHAGDELLQALHRERTAASVRLPRRRPAPDLPQPRRGVAMAPVIAAVVGYLIGSIPFGLIL